MHVRWLCKCIKWICNHLETVNLDQEENKENSSDFMYVSNSFKTILASNQITLNPLIAEIVYNNLRNGVQITESASLSNSTLVQYW